MPTNSNSIAIRPSLDSDDVALQIWLGPIRVRNKGTARNYLTEVTRFRIFLAAAHPDSPRTLLLQLATEADVMMYECALGNQLTPSGTPMNLKVPDEILSYFQRPDQPFERRPVSAQQNTVSSSRIAAQDLQSRMQTQAFSLLNQSSINQALMILHGMYTFFSKPNSYCSTPYVLANPVTRLKRSMVRSMQQTHRYVPIDAIRAIREHIAASQSKIEHALHTEADASLKLQLSHYKRMRWIFALFFALWGRRAEIANLKMCDFIQEYSGWSVRIKRKGGHEEKIPAPNWLIDELMQYRSDLGLSATPLPGEQVGAIMRLRKARQNAISTITHQALYVAVKKMAAETAQEIEAKKLLPDLEPDLRTKYVRDLLKMTPHWFRHSVASYAINNGKMSLETASKRLAHRSTDTTSRMYHHADIHLERAGVESLGDAVF